MILLAKDFNIDISKMHARLKAITSSNYDGICQNAAGSFDVQWKNEPSNEDLAVVEMCWNALTEQTYNASTAEESAAKLAKILADARTFGDALIVQFAFENVAMGITQASKTRAVADYCQKLQYYTSTGSLYAAIEEIEDMCNNMPPELAPFVTVQRMTTYSNKLKAYLGAQ